jgi:methylated-DNA-[protein]-cysteine S-methyltransferase
MNSAVHAFPTPAGRIRLRQDGDAIVALDWGEGPADPPTPLLRRARAEIEAFFAGRRNSFDLPLAPQGTEFQRRVWRELAAIPKGRVLTYGELASRLSSSPRAIGGACGANPIPIIIPCHRVLARAGLGGYSGAGGLATKTWLLAFEGVSLL